APEKLASPQILRHQGPLHRGRIRTSLPRALPGFLLFACLCVNALMFLMPGFVSPELPQALPYQPPTAI
ncbi:MAG TPA: hypothetical protein VLJ17_18040, partial [Xanthobacteraceae bacterium]|nr:hypothetical protein [Xanthobacteraceae bacterium]